MSELYDSIYTVVGLIGFGAVCILLLSIINAELP